MVAIRVDEVSATGANTFDVRKLLKRRDRLAEKLAEPRLPLLLLDGLVGEAGHSDIVCLVTVEQESFGAMSGGHV